MVERELGVEESVEVECPECHGFCEVNCVTCGHLGTCPTCDGSGTVKQQKETV